MSWLDLMGLRLRQTLAPTGSFSAFHGRRRPGSSPRSTNLGPSARLMDELRAKVLWAPRCKAFSTTSQNSSVSGVGADSEQKLMF